MSTDAKPLVPALDRALAILEVLARSRNGLTLSQLTRSLGLPKSSVYCLLRTFEDSGYLHRDNGKYRISLRICDLARHALNGVPLREYARPFLKDLSDRTGLTVHLAVLEQSSCILIEKIIPPGVGRTATWVGKQLGLHCTAIGKSLAAYLKDEKVDQLIREQGLMRYNDNTICSLKRFKQELETVRQRGYALDDEEEEIGIRCIGAGILNADDEPIAALSVVGTTGQIYGESFPRLVSQVIGTARSIGDRMKNEHPEYGTTNGLAPGATRPAYTPVIPGNWMDETAQVNRHRPVSPQARKAAKFLCNQPLSERQFRPDLYLTRRSGR